MNTKGIKEVFSLFVEYGGLDEKVYGYVLITPDNNKKDWKEDNIHNICSMIKVSLERSFIELSEKLEHFDAEILIADNYARETTYSTLIQKNLFSIPRLVGNSYFTSSPSYVRSHIGVRNIKPYELFLVTINFNNEKPQKRENRIDVVSYTDMIEKMMRTGTPKEMGYYQLPF